MDRHLDGDVLRLFVNRGVVRVAGGGLAALPLAPSLSLPLLQDGEDVSRPDGSARALAASLGRLSDEGVPHLLHAHHLEDLLHEGAAVHDERRQRDAARQLLDVPSELHGLELRHLGELQRLGRGDDGDPLGDLEGLLQLLGAFGAEEFVDGFLRLLQVAAHHAQARDVQGHDDGEGDQAHHHVVHAHVAVGEDDTQRHCAVGGAVHVGRHAGVLPAVCKLDAGNVEDAIVQQPPLPSWRKMQRKVVNTANQNCSLQEIYGVLQLGN